MSALQDMFNRNENESFNLVEGTNIFNQPSQIVSAVILLCKYQNSSESQVGHKSVAIIPNEFNRDIFNIICYETKNRELVFSIPINSVSSLSKYKFAFTIIDGNIISFHDHMQSSVKWKLQFANQKIFNEFVTGLTMAKIPNISYKWEQNLIIQDLNIPSTDIQYKYDPYMQNIKIKLKTHLKIWTFSGKHPFVKGPLIFDQSKMINMRSDKVIPALRDGLLGVKQSAIRLIIASPNMCFGSKGNKALNISPNSPLIFEVNVIKIHSELCKELLHIASVNDKVNIQAQIAKQNDNKEHKDIENNDMEIKDKFALYDARLDSLSMGIDRNNKLMMGMQNSMNTICQQINDLRLIVTEEKKNNVNDHDHDIGGLNNGNNGIKSNNNMFVNELKHIKKEINLLKKIMNFEGNTELHQVQVWMMNVVGLPQYTKLLVENGFDNMDVIKAITFNDLELLGMDKLGHKKRIIQKVALLNERAQCEGVASNN